MKNCSLIRLQKVHDLESFSRLLEVLQCGIITSYEWSVVAMLLPCTIFKILPLLYDCLWSREVFGWLEFNLPFQQKYGYIRDDGEVLVFQVYWFVGQDVVVNVYYISRGVAVRKVLNI